MLSFVAATLGAYADSGKSGWVGALRSSALSTHLFWEALLIALQVMTKIGRLPICRRSRFSRPVAGSCFRLLHYSATSVQRVADYFAAAFLRAAHRFFIISEMRLRPAAVIPPFLRLGAVFVAACG